MKLPNFFLAEELNQLRKQMNAELINISTIDWKSINSNELIERLNSIEGILVDIKDIKFCPDGTFEYQDQKVLVYIRDQRYVEGEYKYHVCSCRTITDFIINNRIDRFVVSKNIDGIFKVNIVDPINNRYIKKNVEKELKVCKNCLMKLNYKGYSDYKRDNHIFISFRLEDFFKLYKTNFPIKPKYTNETAPPDLYGQNSRNYYNKFKESYNWTCQKCGINLLNNKKFLNVHHINGVKSDDEKENLKCLCIKCHSEEPQHSHLRFSIGYVEFMKMFYPS